MVELVPKVTIGVVVALALAIDSEGAQATFYLSMMVVTLVTALFALRLTKDISNGTDVQIRSKLALQQSMERAQAADRAKSVFSRHHQSRNPHPAGVPFWACANCSKTVRKPETRRRYLKLMSESGESLLQLLNDILDLSLAESGDIRVKAEAPPKSANSGQTAISMVRQRAEMKGLEIQTVIANDVPHWIRTDPSRIRQVLINLLGNAVKFSETGTITLRISLTEPGANSSTGRVAAAL